MSEFITVDELIVRDKKQQKMYQIQGIENTNEIKLLYLGKFDEIPTVNIFVKDISNIKIICLSYAVSEEDLYDEEHMKMIGLVFIDINTKDCLGTLDYVFSSKYNVKKGIFKTIFSKDKKTVLNESGTFIGKDNLIEHLLNVMIDNKILENEFPN